MGFGSYDESEQEQPGDEPEDNGESVEKHPNGGKHEGRDGIADESVSDMMSHL